MMQRINYKVFLSTEEIERFPQIMESTIIQWSLCQFSALMDMRTWRNVRIKNEKKEREKKSNLILDGRGCHHNTKSRPTLFLLPSPFAQLPHGGRAREDVSPRGQQWAKAFNCIEIPVEQMCGQIRQ